LKKGVGKFK